MTKIKLKKEEEAKYGCKAVYSYKDHLIEGDDCCFSGGHCYWYCEDIFGMNGFWTLRGLRLALGAIEEGWDPDKAYNYYCMD